MIAFLDEDMAYPRFEDLHGFKVSKKILCGIAFREAKEGTVT